MKTVYNYFAHKKNTTFVCIVLVLILFSGCKKNDEEVDSSVIESKLITGTNEHWSTPIHWDNDGCSLLSSIELILNANHTFTYTNRNGNCSYQGLWSVDYNANRSGQFLSLNLMLANGSAFQSFDLKYSSEEDLFYFLHKDKSSIKPFVKVTTNP